MVLFFETARRQKRHKDGTKNEFIQEGYGDPLPRRHEEISLTKHLAARRGGKSFDE